MSVVTFPSSQTFRADCECAVSASSHPVPFKVDISPRFPDDDVSVNLWLWHLRLVDWYTASCISLHPHCSPTKTSEISKSESPVTDVIIHAK